MSGLSEPIFSQQREMEALIERTFDRTVTRVEDALFASITALWDENPVELDMSEHDFLSGYGARQALASLAKDFDLESYLVKHDGSEAGKEIPVIVFWLACLLLLLSAALLVAGASLPAGVCAALGGLWMGYVLERS